jgi:uncharacterized RDD family membrane protein YckC
MRAIAVASFHHYARRIDHDAFSRQHRDMGMDSVFRLGEWLGSMPYVTTRIDAMRVFMESNLYRLHEERFVQQSGVEPVHIVARGESRVEKKDCAGVWRRLWALCIDVIVVGAIINIVTLHAENIKNLKFPLGSFGNFSVVFSSSDWLTIFGFLAYCAALVSLVGQTPGMLIAGLRVVRTDFGRVGLAQALWRYVLVFLFFWYIIPLVPFGRIFANDKWSGTRLIKTERVLARTATA